jgi:hypothetical protein
MTRNGNHWVNGGSRSEGHNRPAVHPCLFDQLFLKRSQISHFLQLWFEVLALFKVRVRVNVGSCIRIAQCAFYICSPHDIRSDLQSNVFHPVYSFLELLLIIWLYVVLLIKIKIIYNIINYYYIIINY